MVNCNTRSYIHVTYKHTYTLHILYIPTSISRELISSEFCAQDASVIGRSVTNGCRNDSEAEPKVGAVVCGISVFKVGDWKSGRAESGLVVKLTNSMLALGVAD